jgi:hypothetical protein
VTWISGACTAFRAVTTTKSKRPAPRETGLEFRGVREMRYLLIASCTATATATDAPTMGLFLLPPRVHPSVRLHVLAPLRACRTPKSVLVPLRSTARGWGYLQRVA